MTESEAKAILEAYMECYRRKTEVAYDYQCDKDCEACGLNYEQGTVGEHNEAVTMAINALEKQIPKKPIIKQGKYCNAYHCPVCNGYIRSTNTRIEVILEENIFCGVCGQKLNWESDEE